MVASLPKEIEEEIKSVRFNFDFEKKFLMQNPDYIICFADGGKARRYIVNRLYILYHALFKSDVELVEPISWSQNNTENGFIPPHFFNLLTDDELLSIVTILKLRYRINIFEKELLLGSQDTENRQNIANLICSPDIVDYSSIKKPILDQMNDAIKANSLKETIEKFNKINQEYADSFSFKRKKREHRAALGLGGIFSLAGYFLIKHRSEIKLSHIPLGMLFLGVGNLFSSAVFRSLENYEKIDMRMKKEVEDTIFSPFKRSFFDKDIHEKYFVEMLRLKSYELSRPLYSYFKRLNAEEKKYMLKKFVD